MTTPFNKALDQNPARLAIVINRKRSSKNPVGQALAGIQMFVFSAVACCGYLVL